MRGKLWRIAGLIAMWLFVSAAGPPAVGAAPAAQSGPTTWTVLVGAETTGADMGGLAVHALLSRSTTINEGDSIVWRSNAGEFHAVNFLPPGQTSIEFTQVQGQDVVDNPEAIFPAAGRRLMAPAGPRRA